MCRQIHRRSKSLAKSKMDTTRFVFLLATAAMWSVVGGEKCGYDRGPLAATNDTVVVKLDCSHPAPFPREITSYLGNNITHLAVQLLHCHTVPVGLFANVTDNLTSVTVASEDAVELLEGTFEGLGHVTELRLLGFSSLLNLSRSLFEPLKNIETLILDRFCRSNIKLSHIGSVIQRLSGTPLKRLVLNDIRNRTKSRYFKDTTMQMNDFTLSNASVKELIISNAPIQYERQYSACISTPRLLSWFHSRITNKEVISCYVGSDLIVEHVEGICFISIKIHFSGRSFIKCGC